MRISTFVIAPILIVQQIRHHKLLIKEEVRSLFLLLSSLQALDTRISCLQLKRSLAGDFENPVGDFEKLIGDFENSDREKDNLYFPFCPIKNSPCEIFPFLEVRKV